MERDTRARKNKMTNSFLKYFKHEITSDSSIDINIQVIETDLGITLPNDYKEMIKELNGFEGFINNAYIVFWPVSELIELNEEYGVGEFAPGILLFGSDGGNQAFGYDVRDNKMKIISIPFIEMDLEELIICGKDMNDFFRYLLQE